MAKENGNVLQFSYFTTSANAVVNSSTTFYAILLSSVTSIIPPAGVCPMKVFEIEFGLLKVVISLCVCG